MADEVNPEPSGAPTATDEAAAAGGRGKTPLDEAVTNPKPKHPDAEQAGNEDQAREQEDFRESLADAIGAFGGRTSNVTLIGHKINVTGSITGGDATFGRDSASALLSTIAVSTIERIARVFVQPSGYPDLVATAGDDRVILLRARRRWGSSTTAIQLMSGMKAIHELRFNGSLATLQVEELPKGCGYVVERLTATQLGELRERDISALEERFAKRDARLVLILDAERRLHDHAVARLARVLDAPPSAYDLVASHLAEHLSSPREADAVLKADGLMEVLQAVEIDAFDVQQLVELAQDLAGTTKGESTINEALARFEDRRRLDVEDWLDGITEFDQRATVVALAALEGMPYDAVSRAATMLERAWRADEGGGAPPSRARRPRNARLRAARARITTEVRRTRYGTAELEVASFVSAGYPARVLEHLWREHDYDREIVLDWLEAVAQDVEGRVRIRAASAIGFLARIAFDTIRRDVVVPWAGSGNGDERERAVAALAMPARYPETGAQVVRLVLDWCRRDSLPLRMTAARALGASVGEVLPGGPDKQLDSLAKNAGPALSIAIGFSITELMVPASPDRRLELLRLLERWSLEGNAGRQRAGILGFLQVAAGLWTHVAEPDGEVSWPTLLRMADAEHGVAAADAGAPSGTREVIAGLWGRSLVAPGADYSVRNVLRSWASAAKEAPALRLPLISLLQEAAKTRRQADLLASHAKNWRDQRPYAPDLAEKLLKVLTEGTVRVE
ncbi:hypothetical protein ACGF3C_02120 [Micromonospora sp. NPDC047762]|uniref:hypothetical protein n=1 Tax=Micromonospora sp. NPDC047762 TaxID=3364255 RepID=UPI0037173CFD